MRFSMAKAGVWKPLLVLLGATDGNSYLELDGDAVVARFGLFTRRFPLGEVTQGRLVARQLPWYRSSIGWRSDLVRRVALLSSTRNVVGLTLREAKWGWMMGVPVRLGELFVSLEDPDAFLAALAQAGVPVAAS